MFADIIKQVKEPDSLFSAELYAEWLWHGEVDASEVVQLRESDFVDVVVEIETRYESAELAEKVCDIYYS